MEKVRKLQSMILREFISLQSVAFYVAAVCTCYFLTSTPRTAGAIRLPLFIGLFVLIFLERLVSSWGVTDSQSTDTTVKCAFSKSTAVSMVYTLKDHKNNFQNSSGSEWFQCHFMASFYGLWPSIFYI